MFDEPYRWVDAINQRRDYIEDQLKRSSPVIAVSVEEGILLVSFYRRTPKLFELYDRMAMGSIGHPADLEAIRMSLINTAHVEGFTRSSKDVSIRRLVMFNLSPKLKTAFEDVMSSPLIFRGVIVEAGVFPKDDQFIEVDFDGQVSPVTMSSVISSSEEVSDRVKKMLPSTIMAVGDALPLIIDSCFAGNFDVTDIGLDSEGKIVDEAMYREQKEKFIKERVLDIQLVDRFRGVMKPLSMP